MPNLIATYSEEHLMAVLFANYSLITATTRPISGFRTFISYNTKDVSWFFTEEWQAGERKADDDLLHGRYTDFDTVEELLAHLNAERKKKKHAGQKK